MKKEESNSESSVTITAENGTDIVSVFPEPITKVTKTGTVQDSRLEFPCFHHYSYPEDLIGRYYAYTSEEDHWLYDLYHVGDVSTQIISVDSFTVSAVFVKEILDSSEDIEEYKGFFIRFPAGLCPTCRDLENNQ